MKQLTYMILYISQRFFLVKIFDRLESLKLSRSRVCEAHSHHVIVSLCDITMHAIALCHCAIKSSCHPVIIHLFSTMLRTYKLTKTNRQHSYSCASQTIVLHSVAMVAMFRVFCIPLHGILK